MLRIRAAVWALVMAGGAAATSCSDTNDGNNGGKPGTSGCTGTFCVEADQRPSTIPDKLVFTDLAAGEEQTLELKVANIGSRGTLQLTGVSFSPPTDEFKVTDFVLKNLTPGQSAVLHVTYTPKVTGARNLNLILDNNAVNLTQQHFPVPVVVIAGGSSLLIQPSPVDFGNIAGKTGMDKTVNILNIGDQPMQLATVQLSPTGSADFTLPVAVDVKTPIEAGMSRPVVIHYVPLDGDQDTSKLLVELADGRKDSALVLGGEIAPDIVAIPPKRDYGSVTSGSDAVTTIKLLNQGQAPLHIEKIEVVSPALKNSTFELSNLGPIDLAGKADVLLTVTMHCKEALPNNGSPLANLEVHSNDPGTPVLKVPLFGHTDAGSLKVTPSDVVDYGFVGKGVKSKKKVELFNQGTAPIDVNQLTISDDAGKEFTIVPSAFKPASPTPGTQALDAGKYDAFEVQFEAKGAPEAAATAKLHILSTDPQKPDYILELKAMRKSLAECSVTLVPVPLNFGLLAYGTSKILKLSVQNNGSGYCSFDSAKLTDCKAPVSLPGLPPSGPITCVSGGSTKFKTFAPSTKLFDLGPGDVGSIQVEFDAPETLEGFLGLPGGKPNEVTPMQGLIVLQFKDTLSGAIKHFPAVDMASPAQLAKAAPNLIAQVGKADVQVLPDHLEFGIVTVGCKAAPQEVSVYNTGSTEAAVTKVEMQGCGPEMDAVAWPAIPKGTGLPITTATPAHFKVQYAPQNVGKDQCSLAITTDLFGVCADKNGQQTGVSCGGAPSNVCKNAGEWCMGQQFTVPLIGEGTLDTEFTDVFDQGTGKKVDVLFVIDNSGSMSNKQNELAKNFKEFVKIATLWNNDYHIGVVTTDVGDPGQSGKLMQTGGVRIVTKGDPDPTGKLLNLANQGANGSGDEQGLEAAYLALKLPLTADTMKPCTADKDCGGGGAECVLNPDDGKKACGGHNRAFLRKNAALEIVVLSDEEDSSPSKPDFYANYFYSIHGTGNKSLFHFHAIAGDPNSGCKSNGGADAGNRYYDIVQKTGGKFGSICAPDYAQFLKDIGNAAFGLTEQYFLTRTPEPSTIDVKINGVPCALAGDSWSYDGASNSVSFVPAAKGGKCMPQKGDKIAIHYKMLCFP